MAEYNFDWNYVISGSAYVTISSGSLAFNRLAVKKLNAPPKVLIGFDEERKAIGVKPVSNDYAGPEKVYPFAEKQGSDGWIRIGCRDFISTLAEMISDLDFEKSQRFGVRLDGDTLVIKIEKDNLKQKK